MADVDVTAQAFTEALGSEIAYWRKRRGMSREELAKRAGVSESTLGRIERDGPKDVADTWNLAEALGVPFQDLVRRAEEAAEFDKKAAIVQRAADALEPDDDTDSEEDEAARAVDRLDRRVRDTRPTRKRSMQQIPDMAARDEDAPRKKGRA